QEALIWLAQFQYIPFLIQKNGALAPLHSVEDYFSSNTLESDNFVLRKV
ncbi:MAG: hypothetical protein HC892_17850, partial [Saprospiraceae bacterium]|nr:hypothetical protein [Saprospiraceae bacterium]